LAAAAAGFTILPAATTYERIWRVERKIKWVRNPEWLKAEYEITLVHGTPVFGNILMNMGNHETLMRYNLEKDGFKPVFPWIRS